MKLNVRLYGDPCLRKKSALVKEVGVSERMLIRSMLETMYSHKGIGLAAPQVGINQQIFVADVGDGPVVIVNPKIVRKSGVTNREEGCLSIPGVMANIKRPAKIWVKYIDENNQVVEQEYSDLMARVFLHETDHLLGKLIIDYLNPRAKAKLEEKLTESISLQNSPFARASEKEM